MLTSVSRAVASSARSFSTAAVRLAAPKAAPKSKAPSKGSALAAGKPMPGLSVLKDVPDPVARADEEYPAWLWTILEPHGKAKDGEFDFMTERKRLRANNRTQIKAANYLKTT